MFAAHRNIGAVGPNRSLIDPRADQSDLLSYAQQVNATGPLDKVVLVHGDPKPQKVLADLLVEKGFERPFIPAPGDTLTL